MRGILCERRACNARQSCFLDATLSRYCTSNGTGRPLDFLPVQAVPAMSRCAHFILRVKRCMNTAPMVAPASPGPRVAIDRTRVVSGKSVSVGVDIGGRRNPQK